MRLEVIDQGRFEKLALVDGSADRDVDGRSYIGGYRLGSRCCEEIWFDKSVWHVETLPKRNGVQAYRLTRKEA